MRVAVIGSRNIKNINLAEHLPPETAVLISGGAKGVDTCAWEYAREHGIPIEEYLPDYEKYGRGAPLRRNIEIIKASDMCLAFYDGRSRGTAHVIKNCKKLNVPVKVILQEGAE